jgi:predicted ribosomally synthesized peptide with nif11-like leader
MEKMKELYQKVAADANLQSKFSTIIQDAEKAGAEETGKKLLAFAKEAGYDIEISEMQEFFSDLAEQKNKELSETELDMVAGGKSVDINWGQVAGTTIAIASLTAGATVVGALVVAGCGAGAAAVTLATM